MGTGKSMSTRESRVQTFAGIFRIAEQHPGIGHVEHRVRHISCPPPVNFQEPVVKVKRQTIAARHPSLHHDDMLALPRMENGHARNRRTRFKGNWVHGIVSANHERNVGVTKVVINLIHFQNNCASRG